MHDLLSCSQHQAKHASSHVKTRPDLKCRHKQARLAVEPNSGILLPAVDANAVQVQTQALQPCSHTNDCQGVTLQAQRLHRATRPLHDVHSVYHQQMQMKHETGCSDTGCSQKSCSSTRSTSTGSRTPCQQSQRNPFGRSSMPQMEQRMAQLLPGLRQNHFQALKLLSQAPPLTHPT